MRAPPIVFKFSDSSSVGVCFVCAGIAGGSGTLRRYGGYAMQATQPVNCGESFPNRASRTFE